MKEFIIELKVIKVFSVKNYKRYPTHTKKCCHGEESTLNLE